MEKGAAPKVIRNDQGTPQGGVISPLLSNLYLHWFEVVLLRELKGENVMAGLVRYADDFVILSGKITKELQEFIEEKLEGWMGLRIEQGKDPLLSTQGTGAEA